MKRAALIAATLVLLTSCGDDESGFDEAAVRKAVAASEAFQSEAEEAEAVETFRQTCSTPDNSVNPYSVYDLVTNADNYPPEFVATARLGCAAKFEHVSSMIEDGECFGGVLAGCSD